MAEINRDAHLGIEAALHRFPAKYPIRRVAMSRMSVAANANRSPTHTIYTGQVPRRILICMLTRTAFYGTVATNPFLFHHFDLEEISITCGGVRYNRDPLRMHWGRNTYLRAYNQLMEATNFGYPNDAGVAITPELFKAGMCIFAFNLSPTEDDVNWELSRMGSTTIELQFRTALAQAIEVLVYSEYDSLIRLDKNREAFLNYLV